MSMQETRTVMLTLVSGEAPQPVEVPPRIESVKLGPKLGEGAAGTVFLGFDESLSRRVAVKLLHRGTEAGSAAREELIRGVRAAAALRHPNIVTVYSAGTSGQLGYIVMEFVDGVSLRQLIAEPEQLDTGLALHVLRDLTDAVSVLHEQGLLHRDLKPGNVVFDRAGELRLCDFGLACPVSVTAGAAIAGTPLYMAPELFDGQASCASDVYALGVILFELLSGEPPFVAETLTDLRAQHQQREVPVERLLERRLAPELCEVVVRALHKQRMLRYKSAAHLRRALHSLDLPGPSAETARRLLAELVARHAGGPRTSPAESGTSPSAQTTFDLVARRAEQKRAARGDPTGDSSLR